MKRLEVNRKRTENESDEDSLDNLLRCYKQLDLSGGDLPYPLPVVDALDDNLPPPPVVETLNDLLRRCEKMHLVLHGTNGDYNRLIEREDIEMALVESVENNFNTEKRVGLVLLLAHTAGKLKLQLETFFMAVFCIDHIKEAYTLWKNPESLAVSILAIASKFFEKRELTTREVVDAATVPLPMKEVAGMDIDVIVRIFYNLDTPTIFHFLRMTLRANKREDEVLNAKVESMSFYLAEASLTIFECLNLKPSVVASSCLFIANVANQLNQHPWSPALEKYSKYTPMALEHCVNTICGGLMNDSHDRLLHFIKEKYKDEKFGAVSDIPIPVIPDSYFQKSLEDPSVPTGTEGCG